VLAIGEDQAEGGVVGDAGGQHMDSECGLYPAAEGFHLGVPDRDQQVGSEEVVAVFAGERLAIGRYVFVAQHFDGVELFVQCDGEFGAVVKRVREGEERFRERVSGVPGLVEPALPCRGGVGGFEPRREVLFRQIFALVAGDDVPGGGEYVRRIRPGRLDLTDPEFDPPVRASTAPADRSGWRGRRRRSIAARSRARNRECSRIAASGSSGRAACAAGANASYRCCALVTVLATTSTL